LGETQTSNREDDTMHKITTPPPRPCPLCAPETFTEGMDRAQALLQKGCDALDDDRFWSGVALGFAGVCRGFGTILCHPVEAIEDLCSTDTPDEAPDAEGDEEMNNDADDNKR